MIQKLCKELGLGECEPLDPKRYGIRKRLEMAKTAERCIFFIERKSRFVHKDAKELIAIANQVCQKSAVLLLNAPLCSKARDLLEKEGWNVYTIS